jgi:exopolysaccharide biosynthesis WecB/TagA/CpsF family protein
MKELDEKINCGNDFLKIFKDTTQASSSKIISFVNPFSYEQLKSSMHLVENIDYFFSDGALLCFFNNIFKKNKIARASFDYSSVANSVFESASEYGMKVAVVGATDDELHGAINALKLRYHNLNIVFSRNGYFENDNEILQSTSLISECEADLVIVGMGTPYQENFSVMLKNNSKQPLVILTCGGFLTQTSIRADYYYPIIKKLGLRWLQRVVMHKHVRDRVLRDYPVFIYNYIKDNIFKKLA